MSQSYPPNPGSNRHFDEIIAIIVALTTIGTILFWTLSNPNRKLVLNPNLTSAQTQTQTQTPTANSSVAQIPEDSLPDGISPVSQTPTPALTTPISPTSKVKPPQSAILGLGFLTPGQKPIQPSPEPQVIPATQSQNTTSTKTACSLPTSGVKVCATTPPSAIASSSAPTPPSAIASSSTATESYWAAPFIVYLINKNGPVKSDQKQFQPDEKITREQFATELQNAFNLEPEQPATEFKDIPQNSATKSDLKSANQSGFLAGYPQDIFKPQQEIPRVQVLVALASGLGLKPATNAQETVKLFKDADQIPSWAIEAVAAATEAGLVVNYPDKNTLNPNQPATYGEVSSMIYQGLVYQKKAEPISSDYLVKPVEKK
ncbi:MAG: S-layer homology domain-containing protein [Planktothrix sp.]